MALSRLEEGIGIVLCVGTMLVLEAVERSFRALKFSSLVLVLLAAMP